MYDYSTNLLIALKEAIESEDMSCQNTKFGIFILIKLRDIGREVAVAVQDVGDAFFVRTSINVANNNELNVNAAVELARNLDRELIVKSPSYKGCIVENFQNCDLNIYRKVPLTGNQENDIENTYNAILNVTSLLGSFINTVERRIESKRNVSEESKGCYIATAIYGSYDCPQVWTLRRYRDYTLAKSWYGKAFIKIYYSISPMIVKHFGNTNWFKKIWRGRLDKIVLKLQNDGYDSTPYEDKCW